MKLFGNSTKWLNIIGLVIVWICVSAIFGLFTYISLFIFLLLLQVIFFFVFDSQATKANIQRKVLIGGLLALAGIGGFIVALLVDVPLWYKLFLLFAQGAFIYAELKMWIEWRTSR